MRSSSFRILVAVATIVGAAACSGWCGGNRAGSSQATLAQLAARAEPLTLKRIPAPRPVAPVDRKVAVDRPLAILASIHDLFSLPAVQAAAAPAQPEAAQTGLCRTTYHTGTYEPAGEAVVQGPDGRVDVEFCDEQGVTNAALSAVKQLTGPALDQILDFFQARTVFAPTRGMTRAQVRVFVVKEFDEASHGGMGTCRDIFIGTKDKNSCELEATVNHELFHCAHMSWLGYDAARAPNTTDSTLHTRENWTGKTPDWVSEGIAAWAEDRFAPATNAEWVLMDYASTTPAMALTDRKYSSSLFWRWVSQTRGDDAIRDVLTKYDAGREAGTGGENAGGAELLAAVVPWPETWFEYAEATSGWQPFFDERGLHKLTDSPAFPWAPTTDCTGESVAIGQDTHARTTTFAPTEGLVFEVDLPPLANQYERITVSVTPHTQFIDAAFTGDLATRIQAGEQVRVSAIINSLGGARVVDWGAAFRQAPASLGGLILPDAWAVGPASSRFRICLTDEAEHCRDLPGDQIHRDLTSIDLVISNAGPTGAVRGDLVLVQGAMPGWTALHLLDAPSTHDAAPAAAAPPKKKVSGKMAVSVDDNVMKVTSDWVWFPRDTYPWDQLGNTAANAPRIHPKVLTAYVNFGCHFEGHVSWRFVEGETEIRPDGWVRRRLTLTRDTQGGFFNNESRFKCELLTRHKKLNALLGDLVTMGQAPVAGFQSALVQAAYMRQIQQINTAPRVPGSFGDLLYETFKSIMTFNAMDADGTEIDIFTSPDGTGLEFAISRDRTVVFHK